MKNIQWKYNLLQIFYWMAICSMSGFAAIFLTSKGLTNTEIGTATGGACILSLLFSPLFSGLSTKFNKISLQTFLMAAMGYCAVVYLAMAFIPMPAAILMGLYMTAMCVSTAQVPFLAQISMDYIEQGAKLNFGLARGMGSISYAISAVLLTQISSMFSPSLLAVVFGGSVAAFVMIMMSTKSVYAKASAAEKSGTFFTVTRKHPAFFMILVGFACIFAAAGALATYLINIIHNHGGSDNLYGIAVFCMAASELPFMAASDKLIKRFGSLPLMAAAGAAYILRNVLIAASPNLPVLMIGMMCQGASYGLLTAVITVYVSKNLKKSDQVMGQTMIAMMTTGLGSTIGNIAGGWLIDNMGMAAMFDAAISMTLVGSFILIGACAASALPVLMKKYGGNMNSVVR